ncbi:hemerythrin domain-containing protein [Zhongshania marina]|uniref:Hemerythrin-like domain-containing protein n=1 Tax=Zhongshania marina TaxID=2304603 RepID=A0ABX9W079_9GAMM|nr:hypothetical protein D0911_18125 [Zhongshania marina]
MQYLLDQLEQDHHRILQMMYSLSNELNHYSNGDNCTKILNILNYIRVYPEIWHHPTEDVLFNQLLSKPSISFKVVNELLKEHPHLEALSVELSGIYQECQSLESPPSHQTLQLSRHYCAKQISHIRAERNIFDAIKQRFNESDWHTVNEQLRANANRNTANNVTAVSLSPTNNDAQ